jgi:hypothetical protein
MKNFQLKAIAAGGLILGSLIFTSCKKSAFENDPQPDTAKLMAFNLVPERTVVIGLSGNYLGHSPLAFNSYTGGYLSVFPGERTVESFDQMTGDSLSKNDFTFDAKKYYSVFVTGSTGSYRNVIVNDNIDSLSGTSGKAYVRYINAINESTNPAVTISSGGTNVVNENSGFANVSEFTAVDPGEITIAVNEGSSIQESRTITVSAKGVYTVLLTSGASAGSDPQIKFILNGVLDDDAASRNSSGRAVTIQ